MRRSTRSVGWAGPGRSADLASSGRVHDHRATHEPVLGTVLTVHARVARRRDGVRAERLLLAEIARLDAVFNVFRADSELSRWRRTDGDDDGRVSADLAELLRLGLHWQARTGGAFNPAVGEATALWQRAEAAGAVPDDDAVAAVAARLAEPRYTFDGDRPVKVGDCSALNFNALAKGLVVERACRLVAREVETADLLVNIGGDLRHVGRTGLVVAVENPAAAYDNAAPLTRVQVRDAGMATSGASRRGVRIGGRWFSHVIDPRTARPVEHVAAASVIAPDAATADVVATLLSVADPVDGVAFATANGPWACCVVDGAGTAHTNAAWDAAVVA